MIYVVLITQYDDTRIDIVSESFEKCVSKVSELYLQNTDKELDIESVRKNWHLDSDICSEFGVGGLDADGLRFDILIVRRELT